MNIFALLTLLMLALASATMSAMFQTEMLFSNDTSNWEPFLTGHPTGKTLVWFSTCFTPQRECPHCPLPLIATRISTDNGATWSPRTWLCRDECQGFHWQFDPAAAMGADGVLHSSWLNNFNLAYARAPNIANESFSQLYPCLSSAGTSITNSSACVKRPGKGKWADKPWMTSDGDTVFLFFSRSRAMAYVSKDSGSTWTLHQVGAHKHPYDYPMGAVVVVKSDVTATQPRVAGNSPNGTVCLGSYANPKNTSFSQMMVSCSDDVGSTWLTRDLALSAAGPVCPRWAKCENREFLIGATSIAAGGSRLYALYTLTPWDQQRQPSRPYLTFVDVVNASTIMGNWSEPLQLSDAPDGVHHAFPFMSADERGNVVVAWFDNRAADGWWNTWARRSADFGQTWSREVRLSNARDQPFAWKRPNGSFRFPFGDYAAAFIDSEGRAHLTWGEGSGWYENTYEHHGNVWMASEILQ